MRRRHPVPVPAAEVELKFQIPADRRAAVLAWLQGLGPGDAPRQRLQAAYVDTPDHALAAASMALRLRREGRQWVQTLKGLGSDGMSRLEHNIPRPAAQVDPDQPLADPALHRGHPLGERLQAVLDRAAGPLRCGYRTDIRRLTRRLRSRHGTVELAFDEGLLLGGERQLPVCELEIELLSGQPRAVLDVARRWALPQGLWLDTRSKAQRGDLMARGLGMAPPVRPSPRPRAGANTPARHLQAVLSASRAAVLENASQIADGAFEPAHLQQLRTALRRLPALLPQLEGDAALTTRVQPLAEAAGELLARLAPVERLSPAQMAALLRETTSQALMLDLLALGSSLG